MDNMIRDADTELDLAKQAKNIYESSKGDEKTKNDEFLIFELKKEG